MIGLDTNVLLRFALEDDPRQAERAASFLADRCTEGSPCIVSGVLAELVWVMRTKQRFPKSAIVEVLGHIIDDPCLRILDKPAVSVALTRWRSGAAGFTDYLIAEINRAEGADATATFDKDAGGETGFIPVPS